MTSHVFLKFLDYMPYLEGQHSPCLRKEHDTTEYLSMKFTLVMLRTRKFQKYISTDHEGATGKVHAEGQS